MSIIHKTSVDRAAVSGVYDKNRRNLIEAGTKYAQGSVRFAYTEDDEVRVRAGNEALALAVAKFREDHGDLDWQSAEVGIHHVSCQVVVELRVSP